MEEEVKYEEKYAELEALVAGIEDPSRDLSLISADVKKAMELIKWCRGYIRGSQQQIETLMKEDK